MHKQLGSGGTAIPEQHSGLKIQRTSLFHNTVSGSYIA
ncbi:hypothetical protein BN440_1217 [Erwinia amylovora MR1]|nr:hypothetical protein BN440_1217 [Erwinia amylovora MR1]